MAQSDQEFVLTDTHLKVLREMIFLWIGAEGGAPGMFGYSPTFHYAEDDDLVPYERQDRHADLCRILELNADPTNLSPTQQEQLDKLHEEMGQALAISLEVAQLLPGDYTYLNYFQKFQYPYLDAFMPPALERTGDLYARQTIPVPKGDTITFHLTDNHLKLMRYLRVDWRDPSMYTGFNFKRPYGSMTYFELDMARILGIPVPRDEHNEINFSLDQRRLFYTLHTEMLYAVPVLLRHGAIKTGHYQVRDDAWVLTG